jgi:hypothetical protein
MVVRRAFSLVFLMILSVFDSTRETIRNSQDKGGRSCVQHNHAFDVYREERLQISWTAASTFCAASRRGSVNAPASTRATVRRGDTKEEVAPECHNENQLGHFREFIEQIVSVKEFCFLDMVE